MTYKEYTEKRQKMSNELPLFFAFSNKQFEEAMLERGLTVNDTDKIYRLGDTGGFYLKKDAAIIREFFTNHDEINDLMKDKDFAAEAFEYEMDNHEYAINYQGDWDVCSCFCKCEWEDTKDYKDYLTEAGMDYLIPAYEIARRNHMKKAEKW